MIVDAILIVIAWFLFGFLAFLIEDRVLGTRRSDIPTILLLGPIAFLVVIIETMRGPFLPRKFIEQIIRISSFNKGL